MAEIKQVRLCGYGGQGIVLAGTILGYAGINDGKQVAGSSTYGAAVRGGTCYSDVVISDRPIIYPHVIKADVLIVMSQRAYDKFVTDVDHENGMVIYDERLVSVKEIDNLKQVAVSATEPAIRELGNKQVANIIILGAAVGMTKIVSKDALISAIDKNVTKRFKDLNLKAAELGLKLGKTEQKEYLAGANMTVEGRTQKPVVNNALCVSCDLCLLLCPDLCITLRGDKTGIEIDYDFCKGCGICITECPQGAIKFEKPYL